MIFFSRKERAKGRKPGSYFDLYCVFSSPKAALNIENGFTYMEKWSLRYSYGNKMAGPGLIDNSTKAPRQEQKKI